MKILPAIHQLTASGRVPQSPVISNRVAGQLHTSASQRGRSHCVFIFAVLMMFNPASPFGLCRAGVQGGAIGVAAPLANSRPTSGRPGGASLPGEKVKWALAQIESGMSDNAVGSRGEVSRYQVLPSEWSRIAGAGNPRDPKLAWRVAAAILQTRCTAFVRAKHRQPTAFEFYVLWNAPSQVSGAKCQVSRRVAERAQRFANLVQSGAMGTSRPTQRNEAV